VVDRLYEAILTGEQGEPDWTRVGQLFSTHACITCMTPAGTDYLDVPTFQAMAREMMEAGTYTGFFEYEVARRVDRIGEVAHVWSVYEVKRDPQSTESLGRGVTSIQLVRESGEWRVVSLCWDDAALDRTEIRTARTTETRGPVPKQAPSLSFRYH
jgi:hypothetical protein